MANNLLVDWLNKKPNLQKSVQSTVNNNTASNVRNVTTPELKTGGINLQKAAAPVQNNTPLQVTPPLSTSNVQSTIQSNNPAFNNGALITPQNQPSRFIGMQQPAPAVIQPVGYETQKQGLSWNKLMNNGYYYVPSSVSQANAYNQGEETRFRNMSEAFYDLQGDLYKRGKILSDYEIQQKYPEFKNLDKEVLKELQNELLPIVSNGMGVDAEQLSQFYPELLKGKELKDVEELKGKVEKGDKNIQNLFNNVDFALKNNWQTYSAEGMKFLQDINSLKTALDEVKKQGVLGGATDYEILAKMVESGPELQEVVKGLSDYDLSSLDKAKLARSDSNKILKEGVGLAQGLISTINKISKKDKEQATPEEIETGIRAKEKLEADLGGNTVKKIATELGVSVDSIEKALYRAYKDAENLGIKIGKYIMDKGGKEYLEKKFGVELTDEQYQEVMANTDKYVEEETSKNKQYVLDYMESLNKEYENKKQKNLDPDIESFYNNNSKSITRMLLNQDFRGAIYKTSGEAAQNADMVVITTAGIVAPEVVLPVMMADSYARESQESFEELMEVQKKMGIPQNEAYDNAKRGSIIVGIASSAVEVYLEKLLGGVETTASKAFHDMLMKDFTERATQMVADRGLIELLKQGAVTQFKASLEEGLEEVVQQALHNGALKQYDPDQKITEGMLEAFEGGFYNWMNLMAGGGDILSNIDVNAMNESAYNAGVRTREIVDNAKESLNRGAFNAGAFLGNMTEDFKNNVINPQGGTNNTQISQQQGTVNTTSENQNNINGSNYNQNIKNNKTLNKVQLGMLQNDNRMNPSKITEFKEKFGEDYGQALADRGYTESYETNVPKIEEDTKEIYNQKKAAMNSVQGEFKDRSLRDMINLMLKKAKNTLDYDMIDKYNALKQKHNSRGLTMEEANDMREEYSYKIQTKWHKDNNSDKIDLADNVYMAVKNFLEKTAEQNGIKDLKQMNREIAMRKFLSTWIGDKAEKQSANNMVSLTDWVILAEAVSNPYAAAGFAAKKIAQQPKVKNAVLNAVVGRRQNRAIDTQNRQAANQQRMESIERANEGKQLQQQLSKPETPALPNGIKLTKVTEIDARKNNKPKNKVTNNNKKSDSSSSDDGGTPTSGTPTNTNPTSNGKNNITSKKSDNATSTQSQQQGKVDPDNVKTYGNEYVNENMYGQKSIQDKNGSKVKSVQLHGSEWGDIDTNKLARPPEGVDFMDYQIDKGDKHIIIDKDGNVYNVLNGPLGKDFDNFFDGIIKKGQGGLDADIIEWLESNNQYMKSQGWAFKNEYNNLLDAKNKILNGEAKEGWKRVHSDFVQFIEGNNKSEQTSQPKNAVTAKKSEVTQQSQSATEQMAQKARQERERLDNAGIKPAKSLPKGHKWNEEGAFTVTTPGGSKLTFLPIGDDLYIKNWAQVWTKDINNTVIENYKQRTANELTNFINGDLSDGDVAGGIMREAWHKMGLPLGLYQSVLKPLNPAERTQPKNVVTAQNPAAKKKTAVEKFREETAKYEPDYEGIESRARDLAQEILTNAGVDAEIVDLVFTGSNSRGLGHGTSDNDILIELKGDDLREDSLFDLLNDEEWNDGEFDFNPILADKSGTLEQVVQKQEKYMKNKRVIKDIADEFGIKWDKELADDAGNMHGDLIKEFLDKTEGPIEVRNSGDGEVAGALDTELYKKNPQNLSNTFYIGGNKKDMDFIKKIKRPETENSKAYSKLFEQYSQPKNKVTSKKSEVTAPKETKVETKTEEKSDLRSKLGDRFYEYMQKQVELTNKSREGMQKVTMEELLPQYIDQFEKIAQKEVKDIQEELNELTKDRPEAKMTDAQREQLNGITDQNERNKLLKKWQDEWIKSHPISDEDAAKVGELMERAAEVVEGHKKARNYLYELEEAQENKENEDHFSYDTYGDILKRVEEAENKINEEFDKKFEEEYDKKKVRFDELNAKDDTDRSDGSEIAKLANDLNNMRNKYDKLKEDAFNKRYPDLVAEKKKQEELFNKDWKKTYRRAVWNLENGNTAKNKVTNNAKNKVTNITVTQGEGKKVDNSGITGKFRNLTTEEYRDMQKFGGLEELYLEGRTDLIQGMLELKDSVGYLDPSEYGLPEDFEIDYHNYWARTNGKLIIELEQLLERIEKGVATEEDKKNNDEFWGKNKKGEEEWDTHGIIETQKDMLSEMVNELLGEEAGSKFISDLYDQWGMANSEFKGNYLSSSQVDEINDNMKKIEGLVSKYGRYWNQGEKISPSTKEIWDKQDLARNLDNNETPQIPTIFEEDLEEMNLRQLDENETPQRVDIDEGVDVSTQLVDEFNNIEVGGTKWIGDGYKVGVRKTFGDASIKIPGEEDSIDVMFTPKDSGDTMHINLHDTSNMGIRNTNEVLSKLDIPYKIGSEFDEGLKETKYYLENKLTHSKTYFENNGTSWLNVNKQLRGKEIVPRMNAEQRAAYEEAAAKRQAEIEAEREEARKKEEERKAEEARQLEEENKRKANLIEYVDAVYGDDKLQRGRILKALGEKNEESKNGIKFYDDDKFENADVWEVLDYLATKDGKFHETWEYGDTYSNTYEFFNNELGRNENIHHITKTQKDYLEYRMNNQPSQNKTTTEVTGEKNAVTAKPVETNKPKNLVTSKSKVDEIIEDSNGKELKFEDDGVVKTISYEKDGVTYAYNVNNAELEELFNKGAIKNVDEYGDRERARQKALEDVQKVWDEIDEREKSKPKDLVTNPRQEENKTTEGATSSKGIQEITKDEYFDNIFKNRKDHLGEMFFYKDGYSYYPIYILSNGKAIAPENTYWGEVSTEEAARNWLLSQAEEHSEENEVKKAERLKGLVEKTAKKYEDTLKRIESDNLMKEIWVSGDYFKYGLKESQMAKAKKESEANAHVGTFKKEVIKGKEGYRIYVAGTKNQALWAFYEPETGKTYKIYRGPVLDDSVSYTTKQIDRIEKFLGNVEEQLDRETKVEKVEKKDVLTQEWLDSLKPDKDGVVELDYKEDGDKRRALEQGKEPLVKEGKADGKYLYNYSSGTPQYLAFYIKDGKVYEGRKGLQDQYMKTKQEAVDWLNEKEKDVEHESTPRYEETDYETLPKTISVEEEAEKAGPKRIAPDRVKRQQETYDAGLNNVKDILKQSPVKIYELGFKSDRSKAAQDMLAERRRIRELPESEAEVQWNELARGIYEDLVVKDISKGYRYPEDVTSKFPKAQMKKAVDARARYEKGLFTSFSSKDTRANYQYRDEIGAGIKSQDGKPVTQAQMEEIVEGVRSFGKVFGLDMKKFAEDNGIIYVHLHGGNPFLMGGGGKSRGGGMNIAGLYRRGADGNISISLGGVELVMEKGEDGEMKKNNVNATPEHELAHAVDYMLENKLFSSSDIEILKSTMNQPTRLINYYNRSQEIVARAVEQYAASKTGKSRYGKPYVESQAYWNQDKFDKYVKPIVEKNMNEKLQDYKLGSASKNSVTASDKNKVTNG